MRGREKSSHSPQNVGVSSDFEATVEIAGLEFLVQREGKHVNLHVLDTPLDPTLRELGLWVFEPLETAIPKLEALLSAAKLAQEAA